MVANQEGFKFYLIGTAPIGYGTSSFQNCKEGEDIINDLRKMPIVEMHGDCLMVLALIVKPNMIDIGVVQAALRGLGHQKRDQVDLLENNCILSITSEIFKS